MSSNLPLAVTYHSVSKRTGLEKAIHQIEEAIKKSKSDTLSSEGTLEQLQHLLDDARNGLPVSSEATPSTSATFAAEKDGVGQSSDDQLALDDAENPLQLLARASDLRLTSPQTIDMSASTPSSRNHASEREDRSDIHRFFLPMRASLDQGLDLDPIDIGLVTMEEAEMLLLLYVLHKILLCLQLTSSVFMKN